jgi:hypothetical protein
LCDDAGNIFFRKAPAMFQPAVAFMGVLGVLGYVIAVSHAPREAAAFPATTAPFAEGPAAALGLVFLAMVAVLLVLYQVAQKFWGAID